MQRITTMALWLNQVLHVRIKLFSPTYSKEHAADDVGEEPCKENIGKRGGKPPLDNSKYLEGILVHSHSSKFGDLQGVFEVT